VLLAAARAASAGDAVDRPRTDIEAIIPIPPTEHERLHYFDRKPHHVVPGTVTINADPYVCDVDAQRFRDRDAFVAHVRTAHGTPPGQIADRLIVREGRVHFIGD